MKGLGTYADMTPQGRVERTKTVEGIKLLQDRRDYLLYRTDRAIHLASNSTTVGVAWSEALRGAAELRRKLARPFDPARIDNRDETRGMPWEASLRRRGSNVSPHPVLTAHMYPGRRNGWSAYQPGTDAGAHQDMVDERMAQ